MGQYHIFYFANSDLLEKYVCSNNSAKYYIASRTCSDTWMWNDQRVLLKARSVLSDTDEHESGNIKCLASDANRLMLYYFLK